MFADIRVAQVLRIFHVHKSMSATVFSIGSHNTPRFWRKRGAHPRGVTNLRHNGSKFTTQIYSTRSNKTLAMGRGDAIDVKGSGSALEETTQLTAETRTHAPLDEVNGDSKRHKENKPRLWTASRRISIITVIKILVFIDMLSVAQFLSLLSAYFRDLGISTELYGLTNSAYSLAQIIGGLVLGALSDRVMSRRSVLLLSFLGSAVGYGLMGLSHSLPMLLLGRVVVGLVRQTMTISTAVVSEHTTAEERSTELARVTAAMTFSFIIGPSLGSALYARNKKLPPVVASSLLLFNGVLLLLLVPCGKGPRAEGKKVDGGGDSGMCGGSNNQNGNEHGHDRQRKRVSEGSGGKETSALGKFAKNLKQACRDGPTMRVLAAKLIHGFLMRSLSADNFVGYYEERFNMGTAAVGHMRSYRGGLTFLVQLYAVKPLKTFFSDSFLVLLALAIFTLVNFAEATPALFGLREFVTLLVPGTVIANSFLGACLESIFTQRVPQTDLGAALGTMNVLLSASGVVGPIYGGVIVGYLGLLRRPAVYCAHFAAFFALWWVMELRGGRREDRQTRRRGDSGGGATVREGDGAEEAKWAVGDTAATPARPKIE